MKEMKQLIKDPSASTKAKAADQRSSDKGGMQTISLSSFNKGGLGNGGNKKKPVFTTVTSLSSNQAQPPHAMLGPVLNVDDRSTATLHNDPSSAVRNGWYNERYDPQTITGCDSDCLVCHGSSSSIRL